MMFSYTYPIRYGDYKNFEEMKPSALLDIIQDVSIQDSARVGYTIHKLKEIKRAWLMQGINVRYEKPISVKAPLTVTTGVKAFRGSTSERCCLVEQEGELVARTIANWFLFDAERGRVVRVSPEISDAYEVGGFEEEFFSYRKPQLFEAKPAYTVRVSNKEIDTNAHLNNQRGAELLLDAIPYEFSFNDMKILYKKASYLGDVLEVCVTETERGYFVMLRNEDQELCVAGTFENL